MKKIISFIKSLNTPLYITTLFVICFVTLVVTAFTNYQNLQKLKQHNDWMEHSWNLKDHLKNISLLLTDSESSLRGYFMTNNPVFLGPYISAKEKLPTEYDLLEKIVKDNPFQKQKLDQLIDLYQQKFERFDNAINAYNEGGFASILKILKLGNGKEMMDQIRALNMSMEKEELLLLSVRRQGFYNEYNRSLWVSIAINVIATLVLFLFYRLIDQNFKRQRKISEELQQSNDNLEATVLARTEQLSILSHHLINIAEDEKRKLARELHDEMGSNLTAINMDLSITIEKLKKIDSPLVTQLIRAKDTLLDTVNLKRRIIEDMRPSMLDHLGLVASLKNHYEKMTEISNLGLEMDIADDFEYLDPTVSIALFRIAQESLNNIIKYAKATTVKISFGRNEKGVWLIVSDNGVGISNIALSKQKSHGLLGMRERAVLLGGKFLIKSGGGFVGTTIETFIPFPAPIESVDPIDLPIAPA